MVYIASDWTSAVLFELTDDENLVSVVTTLELTDELTAGQPPTTQIPKIRGQLTNIDGSVDGMMVEIDYTGDQLSDTEVFTDSDGWFTYLATELSPNATPYTIGVCGVEIDYLNEPYANDDGATSDPTVVGRVSNDGDLSGLLVEIFGSSPEFVGKPRACW